MVYSMGKVYTSFSYIFATGLESEKRFQIPYQCDLTPIWKLPSIPGEFHQHINRKPNFRMFRQDFSPSLFQTNLEHPSLWKNILQFRFHVAGDVTSFGELTYPLLPRHFWVHDFRQQDSLLYVRANPSDAPAKKWFSAFRQVGYINFLEGSIGKTRSTHKNQP